MAKHRRREQCLRPEDVYLWPDEVGERLGLCRQPADGKRRRPSGDNKVYDLVRLGGLVPHAISSRRYVYGHEVIAALRTMEAGKGS